MIRVLFFLMILFLAGYSHVPPSYAGEISVFPLTEDMDHLDVEKYIKAIDLIKNMGAKEVFGVLKWSEIEASPEQYTFDNSWGGITYMYDTLKPAGVYLGIQTINTVKREVPKDLEKSDWDSPQMLSRFEKLIAALSSQKKIPIKAISIGNEVDVYFNSFPEEVSSYISFLEKARLIINRYFPGVPVGTTVTFEGMLKKERLPIIEKMINFSEMVFITYYPVIDLKPLPIENVKKHIQVIQKVSQGKPFILQEIGYPASEKIGSSEKLQAEFFEEIMPIISEHSQIQAAFIFGLHDFSPNICQSFMGYYGASQWPEWAKAGFNEFLCTLGLRHSDGKSRMSYDTVQKFLKIGGHNE